MTQEKTKFKDFFKRFGVIDIDKLKPSKLQVRNTDTEKVKQLATGLGKLGLLEPLLVDPKGNIVSGNRRWKILKKLGWTKVPFIMYDEKDDLKQQIASFMMNISTGSYDRDEADKELLKLYEDCTQKKLASLLPATGFSSHDFAGMQEMVSMMSAGDMPMDDEGQIPDDSEWADTKSATAASKRAEKAKKEKSQKEVKTPTKATPQFRCGDLKDPISQTLANRVSNVYENMKERGYVSSIEQFLKYLLDLAVEDDGKLHESRKNKPKKAAKKAVPKKKKQAATKGTTRRRK